MKAIEGFQVGYILVEIAKTQPFENNDFVAVDLISLLHCKTCSVTITLTHISMTMLKQFTVQL